MVLKLYFEGYMTVDTSHAAVGQHVTMSSPPFDGQEYHCLSFDYKVWVSALGLIDTPFPRLEVYIRTSRHAYSGWMLWTSNGTGEGHVQVTVQAQLGLTHRISFLGVVGNPDTTLIIVANIQLNKGICFTLDCAQEICGVNRENYALSNRKYHVWWPT